MNRKRLIAILLLLLCAALVYAWTATPRQRRVTDNGAGKDRTGKIAESQLDAVMQVEDLNFFIDRDSTYHSPQKNLFAPLFKPQRLVEKPRKPKEKAKIVKPVPKPAPVVPVVREMEKPNVPPMRPLQVLGHLKKDDRMTVFLAADSGRIFLVGQGDRFADDLEIVKLTARDVLIRNTRSGQEVRQAIRTSKSQRLPRTDFKSGRPSAKVPPVIAKKKQPKEQQQPEEQQQKVDIDIDE